MEQAVVGDAVDGHGSEEVKARQGIEVLRVVVIMVM
jgi:hypothetical protein